MPSTTYERFLMMSENDCVNLKLFDDTERTDESPMRPDESQFCHLNREPVGEKIRTDLESFFSRYPKEHQPDLRGRFRGKKDVHYRAAMFELLTHEALVRLGCKVCVHPDISSEKTHPDFLVHCDSHSFYLEVKALDDEPFPESVQLKEIRITLEKELPSSPHHYLTVDPLQVGKSSLSKGAKRSLAYQLSKLINRHPDGVNYYDYDDRYMDYWNPIKYKDWEIIETTSAMRLTYLGSAENWEFRGWLAKKGTPSDITFMGFTGSGGIRTDTVLNGIKEKAGKYGVLDKPFVLAVNTINSQAEINGVWDQKRYKERLNAIWVSCSSLYHRWAIPSSLEISINPFKEDSDFWKDFLTKTQTKYQEILQDWDRHLKR